MRTLKEVIREAAAVEADLRAMPARKLSATAFCEKAREYSLRSDAELDDLENRIAEAHSDPLQTLVRRLAHEYSLGNYPEPVRPEKFGRAIAVAGVGGAEAEMVRLGTHAGEVLALAALAAAKTHPNVFGDVESFEDYDRKIADLTGQKTRLRAEAAEALRLEDLELDQSTLSAYEKAESKAVVRFRNWPGAAYATDWFDRLVEAELAAPRPKRREIQNAA